MKNKIICPNCGEFNFQSENICKSCSQSLLLNDKYILIDILGENNQITYLASPINKENLNSQITEQVIIKELNISSLDNWKIEELFNREILTLKRINHNQIPKLVDNFKLDLKTTKNQYLVMEFIEGITLKESIKNKLYSEKEALEVLKEIVEILSYLHSLDEPIIHRDIKPSNIMIRKSDNKLILIDFGAVADILKVKGGSTVVGTYGFMAPELFMGKVSIQSDYYSLGGVLINLLTKKEPNNMINRTEEFISSLNISNNMKYLISKLMKLKLKDRVKSYEEIFSLISNFNNLKYDYKVKKREKRVIKSNIDNELKKFRQEFKEIEKVFSNKHIYSNKKEKIIIKSEEKSKTTIYISTIWFIISLITVTLMLFEKSVDKIKIGVFSTILVISFFISLYNLNKKVINWLKEFNYLKDKDENNIIDLRNFDFDDELLFIYFKDQKRDKDLQYLENNRILDYNKIIIYQKLLKEDKESINQMMNDFDFKK